MDMIVDVYNNEIIKDCLSHYEYSIEIFDSFDFNKAAACFHKEKTAFYIREVEGTRNFLEANPHYRIPGGSNGNYDPCWGRNRQHHKEGGC